MVYVVLYGKDSATQQKNLCTSKREAKQRFERGNVDKFIVEVCVCGLLSRYVIMVCLDFRIALIGYALCTHE